MYNTSIKKVYMTEERMDGGCSDERELDYNWKMKNEVSVTWMRSLKKKNFKYTVF